VRGKTAAEGEASLIGTGVVSQAKRNKAAAMAMSKMASFRMRRLYHSN
jgi:hypothetical protein